MHALSIASCSWHYGSFILLAGLIWQVLSFYHVWKNPAVSSGCRALSGWGGTALHTIPCLAMLGLQQVPFSLAVCFFSSAISCLPSKPLGLPMLSLLSSLCHIAADLAAGWLVPKPPLSQGHPVPSGPPKHVLRTGFSRARTVYANICHDQRRQLCCPGSKHWLKNSPLIQIHAMELQLPWLLFVMTATEKLPQSHSLLVYGTLERPWS